jgi:DICT domain-containing protein
MVDERYFRQRAERYFRIARAKSDRKMAARLEAMGYEFLQRAADVTTADYASQSDGIYGEARHDDASL